MKYKEHDEQVAFFRRAHFRRYLSGTLADYCFAVPNAGTTGGRRALIAGARRKAEGVVAGVYDIECMVPVGPHTGIHIEMKKSPKDGGKLSDETDSQSAWAKKARECGRATVVALGAEDAWIKLCQYLGVKP
jgi:hypothetical protein